MLTAKLFQFLLTTINLNGPADLAMKFEQGKKPWI